MKVLITSDWHIKATHRGRECRLEDFELFGKKWMEILESEAPDLIVHLGDVFHTLSPYIRKDVLSIGVEILRETRRVAPVYILVGNHDRFRDQPAIGFLEAPNIHVVGEPSVVGFKGLTLAFVPYGSEEVLVPLAEGADLVFSHMDVKGAVLGSGKIMDEGVDPSFPFVVFNGHIHKPQQVGNVVCIGSVMQHDFSEAGDRKRVVVWEDGETRDVFLDDLPSFHVINVLSPRDLSEVAFRTSDYVLLRVGCKVDLSDFEDLPRVFVEYLPDERAEKETIEEDTGPLSVTEEIERWIDELEMEDRLKEEMKELALEVWRQCSR